MKPKDLGYAAETWTTSALTKHINAAAKEAGFDRLSTITESGIYKILDKADIKPFRIQYYCERRDSDFDDKMHNVLLVYKQLALQFDGNVNLLPFEDGDVTHVLSYDEKPGMFLQILEGKYPKGDKIRLILDNLKVHSSQKVVEYLESNPGRFEFVFTPKHASWLNLVEGFFSKMTKQMLRGIRADSKHELVERIYRYFDEINADPIVYHWGWNPNDVDPNEDVKVQTLIS